MEFILVSSLTKVFPQKKPEPWSSPALTLLMGERRSFQLAYHGDRASSFHLHITGAPGISCRQVCLMPSGYPCHSETDENYLCREPGLYPDLLKPMDLHLPVEAEKGQWRSLWITAEGLQSGSFSLDLKITENQKTILLTVPLRVLARELPPQTIFHTEWFHGDCLADYYGTAVFSEPHWQAIDGFLEAAARCGVNMILTPVFTPPLDTAKDGERTTIQLVEISCKGGHYDFGFQNLDRWIHLLQKHGIPEIEISHLFTQWGAIAAPKVMVTEKGCLSQKFGWHTPAVGGEYTPFLRSFLKALKSHLKELGVWEHTWFHISDEPSEDQIEDYLAAKATVEDLLPEGRVIDAMSSFSFYSRGIAEKPVVCEDHLEPFIEANVPGLWTYYCTAQGLQVPNRFFSMPSGRNRILGVLLYLYNLEGFLHWGFNFYNSQFSLQHIDPFQITDAGGKFPSGDPFLVYPAPDYTAWDSIRSEILYEGLEDLRLLQLAERSSDRNTVHNLIFGIFGRPMSFKDYPMEETFFESLRESILSLL